MDRKNRPQRGRAFWRVLRVLLISYAGLVGLIALFQDSLVFRCRPAATAEQTERAETVVITGGEATLRGHLVRGAGKGPRPTLLYFGGNAEDVSRRVGRHPWIQARGWNLLLVAWRGYGRSDGTPSGENLVADARRVLGWAREQEAVDSSRILLWGSSLGTGPAVCAAAGEEVAGLILFAPYDRLGAVASDQYPWVPVPLLFRHEIDAAAAAPRVSAPVLIVHGTADRTVEHARGVSLERAFGRPVQRVDLAGGGHNFSLEQKAVRRAFESVLERTEG